MTTYVLPLLAIVLLCAVWAVFQLWIERHDPDAGSRQISCGNCACKDDESHR